MRQGQGLNGAYETQRTTLGEAPSSNPVKDAGIGALFLY